MLEIRNNEVFYEGIATKDPTLIGYVLLDLAEQGKTIKELE